MTLLKHVDLLLDSITGVEVVAVLTYTCHQIKGAVFS